MSRLDNYRVLKDQDEQGFGGSALRVCSKKTSARAQESGEWAAIGSVMIALLWLVVQGGRICHEGAASNGHLARERAAAVPFLLKFTVSQTAANPKLRCSQQFRLPCRQATGGAGLPGQSTVQGQWNSGSVPQSKCV